MAEPLALQSPPAVCALDSRDRRPPRDRHLPAWSPLAWCIYPLTYVAYGIARGESLGSYPYSFIDASVLGHPQALIDTTGLLAAFIPARRAAAADPLVVLRSE